LQELTDEQLVRQVGRGKTRALGVLVRRHQEQALRLAFRTLGDWHLAEDVVQDAFLRVNRAAPRYKPDAKFGTWFYRIVVNLCMDVLRKRQRQGASAAGAEGQSGSGQDDPQERYQVRELQAAVKEAVDRLGERERIAVILHRFEGLSHREIAEVTETSISAVESVLVRAYRKLREDLRQFSDNCQERPQG
jgi:RNA polymerase sigma-70 factor (ECF subfamily)